MSGEAPAPVAAPVEANAHGGMRAMEAAASHDILNNAENARIGAELDADRANADAAHKAALAAAEAKKAASEASLKAENANKVAEATRAREAVDAARAHKRGAIEKRAVTPEVSALNDRAELEIYGSKGRKYVNAAGETIADAKNPVDGKIAEILKNPKYGKTQAERQKSADSYKEQLDQLTRTNTETITRYRKDTDPLAPREVKEVIKPGEGLELTQAKLVLDLRERDIADESALTGKFIAEGMDAKAAHKRAQEFYEKKDAQRLKLIKEQGVFSAEDYAKVTKGTDLYPKGTKFTPPTGPAGTAPTNRTPFGPPTGPAQAGPTNRTPFEAPTPGTAEMGPQDAEIKKGLNESKEALEKAKNDYAKLVAEQRNGHLGSLEKGKGRFAKLVGKVKDSWLTKGKFNPLRVAKDASRAKHTEIDGRVETAHQEYLGQYKALLGKLDAAGLTNFWTKEEKTAQQIKDFADLETDIQHEQQTQADAKLGRTGKWIAEQWSKGGKFRKVVMVGALPLVVGTGIGFSLATAGAGPLAMIAGGAATGYAGRKEGQAVASRANTGLALHGAGQTLHNARAIEQVAVLKTKLEAKANHPTIENTFTDHTEHTTRATQESLRINKARRQKAGAIAGALATTGFAGGSALGNHLDILSRNRPTPKPKGAVTDPNQASPTSGPGGNAAPHQVDKVVPGAHTAPNPNLAPNPTSTPEHAFNVVRGGGIDKQLQTGLNLSPADAHKAADILDKGGYFNGDKILGIGHTKAGDVIPYLRGAGDGQFHIPGAAIDLLRQNGIAVG